MSYLLKCQYSSSLLKAIFLELKLYKDYSKLFALTQTKCILSVLGNFSYFWVKVLVNFWPDNLATLKARSLCSWWDCSTLCTSNEEVKKVFPKNNLFFYFNVKRTGQLKPQSRKSSKSSKDWLAPSGLTSTWPPVRGLAKDDTIDWKIEGPDWPEFEPGREVWGPQWPWGCQGRSQSDNPQTGISPFWL